MDRRRTASDLRLLALAVSLLATASECGSSGGGGSGPEGGKLADAGAADGGVTDRAGHGGSAAEGGGGASGSRSSAGSGGAGKKGAAGGSGHAGASGAGGAGGKAAQGGSSGAANGGNDGADRPGWKVAWSDEFDDAKGTAVDASKWNMINKGDGFGNNELEYYTDRTDNAATDGDGNLVITAKKESYMGRDYTSARLESSGKFEREFGRFEARIRVPKGQGLWPAFWLLGNNIGSDGWPTCGEIDIMENVGKEPSIVHGSMHGPGYSGGNPLTGSYTLPNGAKLADDFHVFAIEWEMNVVRFYVDDQLYETRMPSDVPAGKTWVYDHPFYVILNVAVGGTWPGSPDGTTTFPQTMLVDYVRVYGR
jgi:beta-glucanase (GH16 family)